MTPYTRLFHMLLVLLFASTELMADDLSLSTLRDIGIPVIRIETVNAEEPTCDYVDCPEGEIGKSITNVTKVPGRLIMELHGETLYDSGVYVQDRSGMTIKIRGNTSAYTDKKPYKIKLQAKADLLLRGDETYADKNWALLKDGYSLNTYVGLTLGRLIGCEWEPAMRYVNLFVNNDYRGIYLLVETVKAGPRRISLDEKTGFVIERDAYWWNEDVYFKSVWLHPWTFKDPQGEDWDEEQRSLIEGFVNQMEYGIWGAYYEKYMNLRSFATWLLAHDILGTKDNGGSNIFLKRYDMGEETKMEMPTLWDFDTSYLTPNEFARIHNGGLYFRTLFASPNKKFAAAYKEKWNEVRPYLFDEIAQNLDSLANSDEAGAINSSRVKDAERWGTATPLTVQEQVDRAKTWFANREEWLSAAIASIDDGTGIVQTHTRKQHETLYDMCGRKATAGTKGIVLSKEGKFIKK